MTPEATFPAKPRIAGLQPERAADVITSASFASRRSRLASATARRRAGRGACRARFSSEAAMPSFAVIATIKSINSRRLFISRFHDALSR